MMDLENRVAIVTGGARGIGLAICEALLARGARVMVADNGVEIGGAAGDANVADAACGLHKFACSTTSWPR